VTREHRSTGAKEIQVIPSYRNPPVLKGDTGDTVSYKEPPVLKEILGTGSYRSPPLV